MGERKHSNVKIVPILLPKSWKENKLQKVEGQIKRHKKYYHNPIFEYFMRQRYLQKLVRNVAFLQHFTFSLKRHMNLLHNLGGEKTFKCEDCAYPATKIIKRELIAESWGANKETQEILSQSHLPIFQEANKSSKTCEDCGFSATFNL